MPFFLIPFALGLSFLLIWTIIGGMIFHDGQALAQHDIDAGFTFGYARRLPSSGGLIPTGLLLLNYAR